MGYLKRYFEVIHPPQSSRGYILFCRKWGEHFRVVQAVKADELYSTIEKNKELLNQTFYVSMHDFFQKSRKSALAQDLNNFYVDIDYYKNPNITREMLLQAIEKFVHQGKIPVPTFIIDSGRGIYIIWSIKSVPATLKAKRLFSTIEQHLINLFSDFNVDNSVKDVARVLRVPFSLNTNANRRVKFLDFNDRVTYEMKDFIPLLPKQKPKKPKDKVIEKKGNPIGFTIHSLHYKRAKDIQTLVELRAKKGVKFEGLRDIFCFIFYYYMLLVTHEHEAAFSEVLKLNAMFDAPLSETEVQKYVQSSFEAYKAHLKDKEKGYNYRTESLIGMFNITEDEMKSLEALISPAMKLDRQKKKKKASRRDENGQLKSSIKREARNQKIIQLYEQGETIKVIAEQFSLSEKTIKTVIKARPKPISNKDQIIALFLSGHKQKEIVEQLGISKGQVSKVIKQFKTKT